MSTPSFEARFVRGAGLRDELEIVYDGTAPPAALFDDLRAIGWVPPVPTPPPATAIDWSRPDPRTGARYSVRSFEAAGRAVPGPDAQRREVVERIVARHLAPSAATTQPAAAPAGAASVQPAPQGHEVRAPLPRLTAMDTSGARREPTAPAPATAAPPAAATSPAPAAPAPTAPAPAVSAAPAAAPPAADASAPREREVQVGATVDEEHAPLVRDELTRRGLAVRSTRMSLTTPGGYRGATAGQLESAVRLQFRAPLSQIDEIVAILGPDATDVVVRR
jgi:hypothetical protein